MKRRNLDPETKMVADLEGLRGASSIADICRVGDGLAANYTNREVKT